MRPRNEQCPQRGPGLTHTVDGDVVCVHCGEMTTWTVMDLFIRALRTSGKREPEPEEQPEPQTEDVEPAPPADPAQPGYCQWQRGHYALRVWYVPNDRKHYCMEHLKRIVGIALWRG